jgi:hypothetical protein
LPWFWSIAELASPSERKALLSLLLWLQSQATSYMMHVEPFAKKYKQIFSTALVNVSSRSRQKIKIYIIYLPWCSDKLYSRLVSCMHGRDSVNLSTEISSQTWRPLLSDVILKFIDRHVQKPLQHVVNTQLDNFIYFIHPLQFLSFHLLFFDSFSVLLVKNTFSIQFAFTSYCEGN